MFKSKKISFVAAFILTLCCSGYSSAASLNLTNRPLFLGSSAPPLLMLVLGKDHKLYYEAYNDASDLNNDGVLDVGYSPELDYYGYFNSYACYDYDSGSGRFVPKSVKSEADKEAGIKTCNAGSGSSSEYAGDWSGDFLNYVTTARIDALRKVFYGGTRSVDTATTTVLERTHIPQDAHTWAKEYRSYESDGYYIDEYTPLSQPVVGSGHLFGNVSFGVNKAPLMRVLPHTRFRPWEWASIERPVLGSECVDGIGGSRVDCEVYTSSTEWEIAEDDLFSNLKLNFYRLPSGTPAPGNVSFSDTLALANAVLGKRIGAEHTVSNIEENDIVGKYFPSGESGNYFMSIITGNLTVPVTANYTFAVNGDDAVELIIRNPSGIQRGRVGWYGGHGPENSDSALNNHSESFWLEAGTEYEIEFRHFEQTGGQSFELYRKIEEPQSKFADYKVRVEVCKSESLLEDNCKRYSDGTNVSFKPTGLLHDYGENDSILFGLLTGSYENNLDGGVLRKNISSFQDEVNPDDGTFTDVNGIVSTISKLRTVNFDTGDWAYDCGWITTRAINNGECEMWGNPIAEMMYETVRYFAGKKKPTTDFDIASSGNNDAKLGLPNPDWEDPYEDQPYCAAPYTMVVSDVNVSYDSDKVPGSSFSSFSGDVTGLNVADLSDTITSNEPDIPGLHYIGESDGVADSAPTAKTVTSLANIRGLAPEEPTKKGSYYSAAIAYYGWLTDLFPDEGGESNPTNINTFAVALASPLPRINIPLPTGGSVSLVPFAKSPKGNSINGSKGKFQPTNTIVDFYVEDITPTSGSFLINFEDVEQGADHDMDAIARYQYQLNADGSVTVTVDSLYAAGGIDQHMGYIISGTTKDGIYLVVRDRGHDNNVYTYYLDTPPGVDPGEYRGNDPLPLDSSRTFTPSGSASATLMKDPLFYAAKWGGFKDQDGNNIPNLSEEWDTKDNIAQELVEGGDGVPDNYFQVTNALGLKDQLSTAFSEILAREASSSTVTVNSGALNTDTLLFQATFNAEDWSGDVLAYPVQSDGTLGAPVWSAASVLDAQLSGANEFSTNREVVTYNPSSNKGVAFRWPSSPDAPSADELAPAQITALRSSASADPDGFGEDLLNYIRGDQSQEGDASVRKFRQRDTLLGDIVNSDPLYVPQPGFFYPDSWGAGAPENSAPYSSFRSLMKDRDPVLYFGANDGIFHAINAYENNTDSSSGDIKTDAGEELLAYVPSKVVENLSELANSSYNHRYFVDGPATYGDAFFGGRWHTALVGTLGHGGQGVFALDITDPKGQSSSLAYPGFEENDASDLVLWEFTDADDADLGFTYGDPVIVRMNNGKWAAIFANGYNNTVADGNASATGNAVLYIVDIETGDIIRKLDTGVGVADDPEGLSRPNGLATPAVADMDGDYIADTIYAGDLFGNLWKFDVSGSSAASWSIAFGSAAAPEPLFVAKDSDGNRLPITSRPGVGSHPDPTVGAGDVLVFFGTGKYMEIGDNDPSGENTQSFFAIWDDDSNDATRSDLLQQSILAEVSSGDYDLRVTTDNEIRWEEVTEDGTTLPAHKGWFIDLVNTQDGNTDNKGERVVYEPILRNDRVIFTTLIPNTDLCAAGGSGWLMEMSAESGSRLDDSPFDINEDGTFDLEDLVDVDGEDLPASGIRKGGEDDSGIPTAPAILEDCTDGNCSEKKYIGTSNATVDSVNESSAPSVQGRQNWREVH